MVTEKTTIAKREKNKKIFLILEKSSLLKVFIFYTVLRTFNIVWRKL